MQSRDVANSSDRSVVFVNVVRTEYCDPVCGVTSTSTANGSMGREMSFGEEGVGQAPAATRQNAVAAGFVTLGPSSRTHPRMR